MLIRKVSILIYKSFMKKLMVCENEKEALKVKEEFENLDFNNFLIKAYSATLFPYKSLDTILWMDDEMIKFINA